jgi:hypothetical protein
MYFIMEQNYIFLINFSVTYNSMSFLPSTQHLFDSHYMFRPQRVIFRCYKHLVLKLHHKSLTFFRLPRIVGVRIYTFSLGWFGTKTFLCISVKLHFMCFSFIT